MKALYLANLENEASASLFQQPAKTLQYISSNGVFPRGDDTPFLENNRTDVLVDRMEVGYNQSKWVAERLVWSAVSRGLTACLFRLGNIGYHSGTGALNPNDFQSQLIKACARLECAPLVPDWRFEITPVDFLVPATRKFSDDPTHQGRAYNVVGHDTSHHRGRRLRPYEGQRLRDRLRSTR